MVGEEKDKDNEVIIEDGWNILERMEGKRCKNDVEEKEKIKRGIENREVIEREGKEDWRRWEGSGKKFWIWDKRKVIKIGRIEGNENMFIVLKKK